MEIKVDDDNTVELRESSNNSNKFVIFGYSTTNI
jgi:hypothetical protein